MNTPISTRTAALYISISFFIGALCLVIATSAHIFSPIQKEFNKSKVQGKEENCLGRDQYATYYLTNDKGSSIDVVIEIKARSTQATTSSTIVHDIFDSYHPVDINRCHFYVIRFKGFDESKNTYSKDYSVGVYQYDYIGTQTATFILAGLGASDSNIGFDFRIDPSEKYIALERGNESLPDHTLVIKDLSTKKDIFTLPFTEIQKKYPDWRGYFDLGIWSDQKDGTYLWGAVSDGPFSYGYFRIKRDDWTYELFPVPDDVQSGVERMSNPAGYLAYTSITTFTGFPEEREAILQDAIAHNKKQELRVINLRTGEKKLIESIDPQYRYDLKWVSDTTLEYHLPDGTIKTYTLPQ